MRTQENESEKMMTSRNGKQVKQWGGGETRKPRFSEPLVGTHSSKKIPPKSTRRDLLLEGLLITYKTSLEADRGARRADSVCIF